jgi:hypothetical protein
MRLSSLSTVVDICVQMRAFGFGKGRQLLGITIMNIKYVFIYLVACIYIIVYCFMFGSDYELKQL